MTWFEYQETFDCLVTPMPLSTRDLEWMAVEWAAPGINYAFDNSFFALTESWLNGF